MSEATSVMFGPLTIWYDAHALRPRPWTQLQSSWAVQLLAGLPEGDVLELCAGAGQIGLLALATADQDPTRRLVQVDEDAAVCRFAERNADLAGVAARVDVRRGRPEEALDRQERFVLVIADPPWVPSGCTGDYPDDPVRAIDGGPDGLDVVRALVPVIEHHLHPSGAALLQVGGRDQADAVGAHLVSTGSALRVTDVREAPAAEQGAVALLRPGR